MSPLNPFSLRIFVADADPDGLRVVERPNWIGRALLFSQGYVFSSSSTSAAVLLGHKSNGRFEWKDAQRRTLKALQELELSA